MELLDVRLTELQRRNRAAFVAGAQVPAALLPGQRVVLRDERGDYFAGTVVDDVSDAEAEPRYLLHVGVRLPEDYAMRRLGREPDADPDGQELLDLLGEAREAPSRLPRQRRMS